MLVFGHATTLKNKFFSGFALLAVGMRWLMSAHDWLIQAVSLLIVRPFTLFIAVDDLIS
jgi:hypothetical protein